MVHDVKNRDKSQDLEILGEALVQQIFEITMPGPKKGSPKRIVQVAGARVNDGELDRNLKYRVLRNNFCIVEDLTIHSLKKFK